MDQEELLERVKQLAEESGAIQPNVSAILYALAGEMLISDVSEFANFVQQHWAKPRLKELRQQLSARFN